ncbi:MAG: AMP-binding protein [Alphaproteobacteria bacterium]|nr:AMP-binding protein [Alphaproteobacteria bacterium]
MDTVDGVFAKAAAENGAAVHLVFTDGTSCSYAETYQRASRFAGVLIAAGIEPGDRVACFMGNSRALYEFFIGCAIAGAIAVPINTLSTARETGALFADCQPKGIVAQDPGDALPDDMFADAAVLRLCSDAETPDGWQDYETALAEAAGGEISPRSRPEDAAMIIYSSGTTGAPKGIVLGHRQLAANAEMTIAALGYNADDRFLTVLPSFHLFGYSFDFLYCGLVRGRMVVLPGFEADTALQLVERHCITVLAGVPLMFVQMFQPERLAGRDVSSLRLIDVGGGPVPVSLVRRLKDEIGIDTVESYGLTEISTVACVQRPGQPSPEGSCGVVLDGIEVRVRDRDGGPVAVGEPGELQFRCGTFMNGYWAQPELTEETLAEGWLHTGDVGRVDGDGNIFILDRIKDMIVANGYNVFPKEVENVLFAHPSVEAAAVIGVPDDVRGEDIQAYVVPAPGVQPDEDEILDYCRRELARYKVPRGVTFTDSLPLTASGKIRRFALRQ